MWSFEDDVHVVFEAKSEKNANGFLSKDDVLQAKGHVDWVKGRLANNKESARIVPIVVSPTSELHDSAKPHVSGLYWVHPKQMSELATTADEVLSDLRTSFAGSDFGQVKEAFCARLKLNNLHLDGANELLTKRTLAGS